MLLVDDLSSGKYMLLEQCSLLMGFFYIFIVVSEVGGKKEAERKEDMGVIRESEEILCIQGRKTGKDGGQWPGHAIPVFSVSLLC